jgi:hypothetical protein
LFIALNAPNINGFSYIQVNVCIMQHELFEHILKTETLSNEMKDVVEGLIKYKARVLLILKFLLIIHLSSMAIILIYYPEIASLMNVFGSIVLIVNVGLNALLLNSIIRRERALAQLKSLFLAIS